MNNINPEVYAALALSSGLKLYASTGIKPNRFWTPKAMMSAAERLTGQKFKARDYLAASAACRARAYTLKEKTDV